MTLKFITLGAQKNWYQKVLRVVFKIMNKLAHCTSAPQYISTELYFTLSNEHIRKLIVQKLKCSLLITVTKAVCCSTYTYRFDFGFGCFLAVQGLSYYCVHDTHSWTVFICILIVSVCVYEVYCLLTWILGYCTLFYYLYQRGYVSSGVGPSVCLSVC